MPFQNKSVLVTGGTSGLGRSVVMAFAAAGANLAFCGREESLGEALLAELAQYNVGTFFAVADVAEHLQMQALVDEARAALGGLDIAVNCAGRNNPPNRLADIPVEEFQAVMTTNLSGVFHAMRAEIQVMEKTGGVIINVASILSEVPSGWMAAYSASKAAVVTLSQSAAEDYRDKGFRIYAFSPGPIDTPMFQQALKDIGDSPEKYAGGLPKIKPMNPDNVAQEILKLAAPDTPHKNGSNVIFDTTH